MQMTDEDYNGLLVRVARLERQSRFWKIAAMLVFVVAAFSGTPNVGAQGDAGVRAVNPTVEAGTFLLKDSAGYVRGKMTVDGDRHPVLEFYDLDGKVTWSTDSHVIPAK
jgi:hypothetical protein